MELGKEERISITWFFNVKMSYNSSHMNPGGSFFLITAFKTSLHKNFKDIYFEWNFPYKDIKKNDILSKMVLQF